MSHKDADSKALESQPGWLQSYIDSAEKQRLLFDPDKTFYPFLYHCFIRYHKLLS
jgi:hypothetical protein